jgi:hypothetical protein
MTRFFSWLRIPASAPLWTLAGIFLFAAWSRADGPPEKRRSTENRFLFVIDTSSAMKSRTNGVQEAVAGLLASGIKGELRKGDTIGLWTYGEQLNTDFPMQVWSEAKKDAIAKQVSQYLNSLRYEKRSHLEKVLPVIRKVVESSGRLTVILIFDGADSIKGTPFDKDINDLHKQYARDFRAKHEPFVTILASRDGGFFDYTINYPGAVVVPHMAVPLPPPETNVPPPVVAKIVPPPVEPKPPARKIEIILSGADFPHSTSTPAPAASNVAAVVTPMTAPAPVVVTSMPLAAVAAPVVVQATNSNVAPPEPAQPVPIAPMPPSTPATVAAAAPATVVPVAAAPPVQAGQQVALFIMAFSLLTIAVVLVLFLVRRWRSGPPSSLISQSIDRSR